VTLAERAQLLAELRDAGALDRTVDQEDGGLELRRRSLMGHFTERDRSTRQNSSPDGLDVTTHEVGSASLPFQADQGRVAEVLQSAAMTEIPARELRNHVSAVLRRVEAGERLTVTVSGRPVAEIVPLDSRPTSISWEAFIEDAQRWRADPRLATELAEMLPDTTDDVPLP